MDQTDLAEWLIDQTVASFGAEGCPDNDTFERRLELLAAWYNMVSSTQRVPAETVH